MRNTGSQKSPEGQEGGRPSVSIFTPQELDHILAHVAAVGQTREAERDILLRTTGGGVAPSVGLCTFHQTVAARRRLDKDIDAARKVLMRWEAEAGCGPGGCLGCLDRGQECGATLPSTDPRVAQALLLTSWWDR